MNKINYSLLRLKMRNTEAFDKAVEAGYINVQDDGSLKWTLGSETLLAYFMGRLFCGDFGQYSRRKNVMIWQRGNGMFPAKTLQTLFEMKSLKRIRLKRDKMPLPENFQLIDSLFLKSQEVTLR